MVCLIDKTCRKCGEQYSGSTTNYSTECGKCRLQAAQLAAHEASNAAFHAANEWWQEPVSVDASLKSACDNVLLHTVMQLAAGPRPSEVQILEQYRRYWLRVKAEIEK